MRNKENDKQNVQEKFKNLGLLIFSENFQANLNFNNRLSTFEISSSHF